MANRVRLAVSLSFCCFGITVGGRRRRVAGPAAGRLGLPVAMAIPLMLAAAVPLLAGQLGGKAASLEIRATDPGGGQPSGTIDTA